MAIERRRTLMMRDLAVVVQELASVFRADFLDRF
jgi:hypothetical protein